MPLYTYGGTPAEVLTTATGDVIPDYPINVRVAGSGELITALYEADGTTPIGQLRSNPTSSAAPGAIREWMCDWPQIEYEYNASGGRTVRWYSSGREVATEALQAATAAGQLATSAAGDAAAALTAAGNASATAATASSAAAAAETAAEQAQTDAAAAIAAVQSRLGEAATVDNLPAVVFDAHRGGAGESPENSVDALRAARAYSQILDVDARLLADGTLVSMHDATIDRVTNKSGTAAQITAAQLAAARLDPSTWFAAGYPDLPIPTVEDLLNEFGGRYVLTIEAKDAASVPKLAAMIKARRLERSVLINSNTPSVMATIKSSGCLAHLWRSASQMASDNPTTIKASGADLLDLDIAGTDAQITAAIAQNYPLGVYAHTLARRVQRDRALALGCRGIIADYPAYVSGAVPRRTASTFGMGTWGPGYVPSAAARPVLDAQGRIPLPPPASADPADAQVLLAGEVSPAPATTTVDVKFSVPTGGSAGWSLLSLHLGADDDATILSSSDIRHNGYTVQVSNNRSLRIYRDDKAAGTSTQLANTTAGADLAAGTVYTLRCVITATQITLSVPEVSGLTTTVTDSTYRVPWSVFVGRNYNAAATGLINIASISAT
ncbi:glycerophosphodiester phosphodiesterase family protein [Streptomyces sp. NBC_01591]|uniref:glycerophosphodiester phosphodiesterase n=1 Tax=Streptomyces sp. NBC_01591 TaxID=2975888 RepID=UPI002DDAEFC8|nr:glycerophosphodiester phosphodiesterase family protein [Streptomyces sp. NBC_01591]WSD71958.1 glycerophosphodiester phosphodiesterase family protein [Streptomyces sp. NBC_01591]